MMNWDLLLKMIIIINAGFAFITVFRSKRDIATTWAWLLVLTFLPLLGFLIYAVVGRKMPERQLFKLQTKRAIKLDQLLGHQVKHARNVAPISADRVTKHVQNLIKIFQNADMSFLSRQNKVQVYTHGDALFKQLIQDLKNARQSINLEFFTFYTDHLGKRIRNVLAQKAREGIDVHVIYESMGSLGTHKRFFKPLLQAGGHAEPYLNSRFAWFEFHWNFRDHRKIVVIDGHIGYIGGFNIGDEYLGLGRFGAWRDTHLRILGSGVYSLQAQFILDWNVTDQKHPLTNQNNQVNYFPLNAVKGDTNLQIVSSGPDSDKQQIKYGYIKLIQMAQKRCWVQTPYLIPDDSMLDAFRMAVMSGVDVRIMVPCEPDHPFVYRATQYYAKLLSEMGVKIYYYQAGFMHAKTIIVDDDLASVGSANFDFRSFKLNFEINAFLYGHQINHQLTGLYIKDIKNSQLQTNRMFAHQSYWLTLKQRVSRLLSPIL